MASHNPLSPLRLKLDKTKEPVKTTLKCPKCSSIRLEDYGSQNGIGFKCKACHYSWAISSTAILNVEDRREFLRRYNEEKESLIKYSEDCAVSMDEYNRIEETIENNNEFFRRRLYGEE